MQQKSLGCMKKVKKVEISEKDLSKESFRIIVKYKLLRYLAGGSIKYC
jgi:hypothetical protein